MQFENSRLAAGHDLEQNDDPSSPEYLSEPARPFLAGSHGSLNQYAVQELHWANPINQDGLWVHAHKPMNRQEINLLQHRI